MNSTEKPVPVAYCKCGGVFLAGDSALKWRKQGFVTDILQRAKYLTEPWCRCKKSEPLNPTPTK